MHAQQTYSLDEIGKTASGTLGEIAAAGTLRITTVDDDSGSDVGAGIVYILAIPVA